MADKHSPIAVYDSGWVGWGWGCASVLDFGCPFLSPPPFSAPSLRPLAMPLFILHIFIFFFLILSSSSSSSPSHFLWLPSASLLDPQNWLSPGAVPCAGDNLRLDSADLDQSDDLEQSSDHDQPVTLALLNGPLQIRKIVLPSNGLLYFGPSAELDNANDANRRPSWQCEKRPSGPEEAMFSEHSKGPNFFDSANWRIMAAEEEGEHPRLLLDAEKVPSDQDRVLFPSAGVSKLFIDVPARVRSLNLSDQALSAHQLRRLLFSVEGQFRFRLGSRIAIDADSSAQFPFRLPSDTVFSVQSPSPSSSDDVLQNRIAFFGRPNSNFFDPQFSALCGFVPCPPLGAFCADPVHPIGQCCPQCGALLSFRQSSLNFTLSLSILDAFIRREKAQWMPETLGISLVRVDKDDFHPLYQLSVLPTHPEHFDESLYCSALWSAFRKVQQRGINAHLPPSVHYIPSDGTNFFDLRVQCSLQLDILRLATLLKGLLVVFLLAFAITLAFRAQYRRSPRLRMFIANHGLRPQSLVQAVSWQRSRREEVQLISEEGSEQDAHQNGAFLAEFVNRAFAAASGGGWKLAGGPGKGQSVAEEGGEEEERRSASGKTETEGE